MSKPPKLAPHLIVNGGLAAIKFYEDVLDADTQFVMMAEDGKRVMHAALEINDGIVYVCDDFQNGGKASPKGVAAASAPATMVHLQFKKPRHVDGTMALAADHGATIVMPAEDMFWGDRYGQIRDPFGHVWTFGAALKHKDEMQADMKAGMEASAKPLASKPAAKGKASKK
jgi:PhnB protein